MVPQIVTFAKTSQAAIMDVTHQLQASKDYVTTLLNEIEILRNTRWSAAATVARTPANLNIDVTISLLYVKYIEEYGPPEDGIFLPSRLAEIQNSMI